MENNCCAKKTKRSDEEKKLIINRLNRIAGEEFKTLFKNFDEVLINNGLIW